MRVSIFRITALFLATLALLTLFGCSSILNGDTIFVSAHIEPSPTSSDAAMEAETYEEIKSCMLSFIRSYKDDGLFRVYSYDGDLQYDVDRACYEIPREDPLGAFAISEMVGTVKQIVSYYEVEVYFAYNNITKEKLDSIITITAASDLTNKLKLALVDYAPSMTALAYNIDISDEEALDLVTQLYYEYPGDIVMLPVTTVDFYPKTGSDRIIDFTFGYRYEASTLAVMEQSLKDNIRDITASVIWNDNDQMLLMLAQRLMESTEYDEETSAGGDYSSQNISATAYSALINGKAVSEGYAMAYKALCDELDVECSVVIGKYKGAVHAWNIVELDGYYYHVDISNCDRFGLNAAFLKNDEDMSPDYEWDTDIYMVCNGPLSYSAISPPVVESASFQEPTPEPSVSEIQSDETVTNADSPDDDALIDNEPTVTEPEESAE